MGLESKATGIEATLGKLRDRYAVQWSSAASEPGRPRRPGDVPPAGSGVEAWIRAVSARFVA